MRGGGGGLGDFSICGGGSRVQYRRALTVRPHAQAAAAAPRLCIYVCASACTRTHTL